MRGDFLESAIGGMRSWVKQLPVTVGVPAVIALVTVPPSVIRTVFQEYQELWSPAATDWILGAALILAALYSPFAFRQQPAQSQNTDD